MRKRLALFLTLALTSLVSFAESKSVDGLFVTASGSTTCYKLSETPTITYSEESGVKVAKLTLKGETTPALSIQLKDGASLQMVYGTYTATAINDVNSEVVVSNEGNKKILSGGKLIIIGKDGRQYNFNGTSIK